MAQKRNMLICFDAFGTLFTPKRPIAQQYGEVARACGLSGFSDEDVAASFKKAFKDEAKQNPNFGRATGMGAEKWWTNIIHNTFLPYTKSGQVLPSTLAPKLLHRFHSEEGYMLYPDVLPLLHRLRNLETHDRVVVGVISNSDDRVPDVLGSLGVRVNPRRYGSNSPAQPTRAETFDIDFTVLSYDVGHEKPDRRIFEAAVAMLNKAQTSTEEGDVGGEEAADDWQKIYVGDEYKKDILGAAMAGWHAIQIDRENLDPGEADVRLDEDRPATLFQRLDRGNLRGRGYRLGSLAELSEWLTRP